MSRFEAKLRLYAKPICMEYMIPATNNGAVLLTMESDSDFEQVCVLILHGPLRL